MFFFLMCPFHTILFVIILLAMTSVLATVSLFSSAAHHFWRHSSSLHSHSVLCLFVSCSVFEKECYLRYHSFSLFLLYTYIYVCVRGSTFLTWTLDCHQMY